MQDYYGNQVLASTEDLLSTSGWRELLADFTTGPQTRLIAIKVMRVPGNPLIKGTFWLDDVKLTLAQTAAADHFPQDGYVEDCNCGSPILRSRSA